MMVHMIILRNSVKKKNLLNYLKIKKKVLALQLKWGLKNLN